jgi:capsular polysaccharide biosynthesis protein
MFSRDVEMWMMLRVSQTKKILVAAAMFIVAACSKQPSAPTPPLVEQSAADVKVVHIEEFDGKFAPGGIAASYRATFSDGQIKSLAETRDASAQTGTYEFKGARLMKYQGAALSSGEKIELEFDERGKVLVSRAGDKEVNAEEISAIRDRAQSLRSHAVATHDVRSHF